MPAQPLAPALRRPVRWIDADAGDTARLSNAVEDIYREVFDLVVVRGAFDASVLSQAGERCDSEDSVLPWSRPNRSMPVEDVQVLGTDTPATPTYSAPRGTTLDAYLASAQSHAADARAAFGAQFDVAGAIRGVLGRFSGGRPVDLAAASDGRSYVPFTIRRLADGRQIGIHHDYHYGLDVYRELSQQVDTGTLVSYVATLREPRSGGELYVYGATSDAPDLPRLPNGFAYDLEAIEARYECARVATKSGDLFLLAAGRCLHRVGRVGGAHARVTMGGFLALDREHRRVLFWS
jgi:hypothetical protein